MVHEPAVLIEGVLFRAKYLGSTQMVVEGRSSKTSRMGQAQEAVARVKVKKNILFNIHVFLMNFKIYILGSRRWNSTKHRNRLIHFYRENYGSEYGLAKDIRHRRSTGSFYSSCNFSKKTINPFRTLSRYNTLQVLIFSSNIKHPKSNIFIFFLNSMLDDK